MTFRGPGFQLFIGRRRNQPITYDDLLDAETRAADADEKAARLKIAFQDSEEESEWQNGFDAGVRRGHWNAQPRELYIEERIQRLGAGARITRLEIGWSIEWVRDGFTMARDANTLDAALTAAEEATGSTGEFDIVGPASDCHACGGTGVWGNGCSNPCAFCDGRGSKEAKS